MAYGISIQNDLGDIQIDEKYQNHHLKAEGTYAMPASGGVLIVPGTSDPEIITIANPATGAWVSRAATSGGQAGTLVYGTPSTTFGYATLSPGGVNDDTLTHGMLIYDSAAAIVFSSRRRSLRIIDVVTVTAAQMAGIAAGGTIDVTHDAVSNCSYLIGGMHGTNVRVSGPYWLIEYPGVQQVSTTISRIGWRQIFSTTLPVPTSDNHHRPCQIIPCLISG